MTISGLSTSQFEDLLSPKETLYGLREVTLLFRRIVHLLTHCEWIDDSALIKRFHAHVQVGGETDLKAQHVFQQLIARAHRTNETSNILDSLLKERKVFSFLNSRFTQEMWCMARDKCQFDEEAIERNLEKLPDEQAQEFRKLLDECKADRSVLKKDKLLAWMTKVEKEEIDSFKAYLEQTAEDIIEGKGSSLAIHENVRLIRQHMVAYGYMGLGENIDCFGNTHEVYYPLMRIIDPDYNTPIVKFPIHFCLNDNHFTIKSSENGIETHHLVTGFTLNYGKHSSSYVFDGSHYVCLDNQKLDYHLPSLYFDARNILRGDFAKLGSYRKIRADELLEEPFRSKIGQFHLLPENPQEFPAPLKWNVPKWERNNCFIASTLLLVSLHHYYKKQGLNTVVNHRESRFSRELWSCLDRSPKRIPQEVIDSTIAILREDEKEQFIEFVDKFNAEKSVEARDDLRYYLLSTEPQTAFNRVYIQKLFLDIKSGNLSAEELELKIQEVHKYIKNHSGESIESAVDAHYCLSFLLGKGKAYKLPVTIAESSIPGIDQKYEPIANALHMFMEEKEGST